MTEIPEWFSRWHREGLISAISVGFFFVLVGIIFISIPNLFSRIVAFFNDFAILRVPNTTIFWPAPRFPLAHTTVYRAVEQFSFAFGLFQVVILGLRIVARSLVSKIAETAGNIVFWVGTGYLTRTLLIEPTMWTALTTWFVFWAAIIVLVGITLIIRAIILAGATAMRYSV